MKFRAGREVVAILAAISAAACAKNDVVTPRSVTSVKVPAADLTTPLVPKEGNLVRVEFNGGMCHIVDREGKPNRTVFLTNDAVPHVVTMWVPRNYGAEADEAEKLRQATGGTVDKAPDGDFLKITDVRGCTFQVVDTANNQAMQPPLERTTEFRWLVPGLATVAQLKRDKLDDAAIDGAPNKKFVDVYDLGGGILSATPYCMRAKFKEDFEERGSRSFAETVVLTGFTTSRAALRIVRGGTTTVLTFPSRDLLYVKFRNQPDESKLPPGHLSSSHFDMHAKVAVAGVPWPTVENVQMFCGQSDTVPGCSSSSWP